MVPPETSDDGKLHAVPSSVDYTVDVRAPFGADFRRFRAQDVRVDALERLRRLCLALPEVTERLSHGEPTWFVRGRKTFVTFANQHHDDRVAFWCAAGPGVRETLVTQAPSRYFRPPYVGHRGRLGVYVDVPVDWDVAGDLVEDAYRVIAPKALVARLERRVADPADLPHSSAHGDL